MDMGKFWAAYVDCLIQGQREGQARFNALALVAPEIADEVVGTALDCFYDDSRVPVFDSVFMGELGFGEVHQVEICVYPGCGVETEDRTMDYSLPEPELVPYCGGH